MKTLYFKTAGVLTLLLITTSLIQAQTLRKEDQKEFPATSNTELLLNNQFGNITVTEWDQSKISISYLIEVTHSDQEKAKKMLDKIKIEFKQEGDQISAKTVIGENKIFNSKGHKEGKQSFRISYTVKCPKSIKLNIDNQFGDVMVSSMSGPFKADVQFGSLNAVALDGPQSIIDIQFGELHLGKVKIAEIDIQYAKMFKISEGGRISLDAQFSELNFGSVESVQAEVNSCQMTIEELQKGLDLESNMSSIKIGKVNSGFSEISIEQNMGDLVIGMDPKAGFKLDANVSMGSVIVPDGMKLNKSKDRYTGTLGNGSGLITIESNMGSVKIK